MIYKIYGYILTFGIKVVHLYSIQKGIYDESSIF